MCEEEREVGRTFGAGRGELGVRFVVIEVDGSRWPAERRKTLAAKSLDHLAPRSVRFAALLLGQQLGRGRLVDDERPYLLWVPRDQVQSDRPAQASAEHEDRIAVLSNATVKTHINRIYYKTGARDRAQAVRYAYQHGLAQHH